MVALVRGFEVLRRICFFYILIVCIPSVGAKDLTSAKILQKMQESYAEVKDYQTHVLVVLPRSGDSNTPLKNLE